MGIILRSNVDASTYATKAITAVTRGLKGMWYFDTSLDKAKNDFSLVSDSVLNVTGTPDIQPTYSRLTASQNFLQSNIAEPDTFSFAIVMRCLYSASEMVADINRRAHAAGNNAGNSGGIALGYASTSAGDLVFGRVASLSAGGVTNISARLGLTGDLTKNWRLVRGRYDAANKKMIVVDETRGVTAKSVETGISAPLKYTGALRIGSPYSTGSQQGPVDISQMRFFDVELDDQEFSTVVAEMRRYEQTHNNRVV